MSKSIQRLETEIGEKLFIRLKRRRKLNELEELKRELGDARGLRRGSVNMGILPTIAPYFLPHVVSRFTEACPGLEILVHEDMTVNLLRMIDACELDLGVMSLPISNDGFEKEALFTEELLLAVPSKYPLAVKEKVSVADLETERFILMKEGHCLGDRILSFCTQHIRGGKTFCAVRTIETIQSLVIAGLECLSFLRWRRSAAT